jgi:hypothetical protein
VIFGVPIQDSVDEIKTALTDQDVSDAKRLPIKGRPEIMSERVLLTFNQKLPARVKMASMVYRVHPSLPNPFRCKKCFRLGHIASRCSAQQSCRTCAKPHPPDSPCSIRCVNCNSHSHTSDSDTCPSFLAMKAIIKISVTQNITIADDRAQHSRL